MKYSDAVDPRTYLGKKITALAGCRKNGAAGEVGIEIECEGRNLFHGNFAKWWVHHADGSLRGEDNAEYVLAFPIARDKVNEALDYLAGQIKDLKMEIIPSYRTSVHVHLNFDKATVKEAMTFVALYYVFEDILFDLAGRERVGNLHCLRACDAEYVLEAIRGVLREGTYPQLGADNLRYAALNLKALRDHGSLEVRSFRGESDMEPIKEWVSVLLAIKDAAKGIDNPQQICLDFSMLGARDFLKKNFSPEIVRIFERSKNLEARLYEGIRLAQDIAWAIPSWEPLEVKGVKKVDDWVVIMDEAAVPLNAGAIAQRFVLDANLQDAMDNINWQVRNGGVAREAPLGNPVAQDIDDDDDLDDDIWDMDDNDDFNEDEDF